MPTLFAAVALAGTGIVAMARRLNGTGDQQRLVTAYSAADSVVGT